MDPVRISILRVRVQYGVRSHVEQIEEKKIVDIYGPLAFSKFFCLFAIVHIGPGSFNMVSFQRECESGPADPNLSVRVRLCELVNFPAFIVFRFAGDITSKPSKNSALCVYHLKSIRKEP